MAAKKKGAAKKTARRAAAPKGKAKVKPKGKAMAKPKGKAKSKARAAAKPAPRRPAAKSAGAGGDVVYSDVLHQLRESLVARLIR